jgi:phosphoribosylcarboxyaminoimidazole (NCAIR) mutase
MRPDMTPSQIDLVQSSSAMKPAANEAGNRLDTNQRAQSAHRIPEDQPRSVQTKRSTTVRNVIGGLAAICLATSPLHAGELSAMAGDSIDLGRFHGVVYYTSKDEGYQVVVTIADGEAGLPVRFSATLAENQSATISVPSKSGEPGRSLEISRSGDKLALTTDVGDTPPANLD